MLTWPSLAASSRCTAASVRGRLTAPEPPATQERERTRRRNSSTSSSRSGSEAPESSAIRARYEAIRNLLSSVASTRSAEGRTAANRVLAARDRSSHCRMAAGEPVCSAVRSPNLVSSWPWMAEADCRSWEPNFAW